ncbi:MAG: sodium/proline symporter [Cellvibrionaceae bacterium]
MIFSFACFLVVFTLIGLSSVLKSRGSKQDYYLADGSVKPWLVGLSAVATNNSGYMFIGVIGYTYVTGLASIWLMFGWILGDFLASTFVHSRLKKATTRTQQVSYAGVLSHWYGGNNNGLQRLIGLLSLIFLLAYASAQLVAGSKALYVLFGWPSWVGAFIGAVMVAIYCFAGGIRASIWTDAAQSTVMIVAMSLLLVVATQSLGGVDAAIVSMNAIDGFLDWFPKDLVLPGFAGAIIFAVSWLFAGFSVIGQPHIMVRFMALKESNSMRVARIWYYLWFTAFYCLATCVGLLSRIYLSDTGNFDAELALPTMALELLPPVLVGLVLAGIFAATMSTADSLVLSCSAAVTHDLLPKNIEKPLMIKITTVIITGCALLLALSNNQSVFSLVILAWAGLASAFAPLLLALCLGWKPSEAVSVLAVIVGLSIALIWRYLGWHNAVYEGLPGIVFGFFVIWVLMQKQIGTGKQGN